MGWTKPHLSCARRCFGLHSARGSSAERAERPARRVRGKVHSRVHGRELLRKFMKDWETRKGASDQARTELSSGGTSVASSVLGSRLGNPTPAPVNSM